MVAAAREMSITGPPSPHRGRQTIPAPDLYILQMPTALPSRADALVLMHEYTANESLRKHMLSVEAAMRSYAVRFSGDVERWGLAGLIHDFDYERFPNAAHSATEEHPAWGVRLLRERGWPEDILEAILGHATYSGVPRTSHMAKTLFAVDELTGLVTATALVKPSKSVHEVEVSSVKKKMKDKGFARGVNREDVVVGAQELGVDLDQHIQFVIDAMRGAAEAIGLAGTPAPAGGEPLR
jgi:predicted hydrolase (HD superfamily)